MPNSPRRCSWPSRMSNESGDVSVDRNKRSDQESTRVVRVPSLVTVKLTSKNWPESSSVGTAAKSEITKFASAYVISISAERPALLSFWPSSQTRSEKKLGQSGNALSPHATNWGTPRRKPILTKTCAYQMPELPGGVATTVLFVRLSPGASGSSSMPRLDSTKIAREASKIGSCERKMCWKNVSVTSDVATGPRFSIVQLTLIGSPD